ncbi:MAG: flagella basal body P-ring formation protein FlgA [Bacteriovoracia bacterium]
MLTFSICSFACEVHLPHNILILGTSADLLKSSATTGCKEDTLLEINSTLTSVEGKISSFQLSDMMKDKGHKVAIQPNLIEIHHLKHLVREQLLLPSGVQLKSSEAVNSSDFLTLAPGDKVEIECSSCLYGSQQPLNVHIYGFDGTKKSVTVRADFKKMVKAYRFIGFHAAFSEVTSEALKEEFVESIPHTDLITELETLKFYKLNKPVRAGELLRRSDLNALNLVKAGLRTEVIIENELVKVKTTGISRSNGTFGQIVEVFHPQKNKKYQGKVIDINKVLVDL